MRFLYTTDLHGDVNHYKAILQCARDMGVQLIHIGADLLPKNCEDMGGSQRAFINKFLSGWFQQAHALGIEVLSFFGNDDFWSLKEAYKLRCNTHLLDESECTHHNVLFKRAYPYVPDYPFGLKTACKLERDPISLAQPYLSTPVDVDSSGNTIVIEDVHKFFHDRGTIDDDLELGYSVPQTVPTVMSFHSPPAFCRLDQCYRDGAVGSKAIFNWILKEQPTVVVCGHIHESPDITGEWQRTVDKTLVVQPGRSREPTIVEIDIDTSTHTAIATKVNNA